MNPDGTTRMKLMVFSIAMNIHKTAKMVGDYSGNKMRLNTDKISGNVSACIGFTKAKEYSGLYVPNTVLREDIRTVVHKPTKRILAIFRKPKDTKLYAECTYTAKGISLEDLIIRKPIKHKIGMD